MVRSIGEIQDLLTDKSLDDFYIEGANDFEEWTVIEENDKVTFLYKIREGATNKSYGINVARLAHLPEELLTRAKEILTIKETNGNTIVASKVIENKKTTTTQLPEYVKELEKLNPLEMTPLEALTYLFDLQKKVKEGK